MTGSAMCPLLFLDVDGPLIPFGSASAEYPTYQVAATPHHEANPLLARINPEHGSRLTALPCELVWATTWMEDANEAVAPILGLPPLALVTWPDAPETEERDVRVGLHWKTRTIAAWAACRPFAWVDDEITETDRAWVSAHHPAPALLHRVDPGRGLTENDYRALDRWLREVDGPPPNGTG